MMLKEVNVCGIYFAPFVVYALFAYLIFVPVRIWLDRINVNQWFWHRALFDTSIFVIILSIVGLLL